VHEVEEKLAEEQANQSDSSEEELKPVEESKQEAAEDEDDSESLAALEKFVNLIEREEDEEDLEKFVKLIEGESMEDEEERFTNLITPSPLDDVDIFEMEYETNEEDDEDYVADLIGAEEDEDLVEGPTGEQMETERQEVNTLKVHRRRAKVLRRKLLKKYLKLRRMLKLIENKLNVKGRKFVKLNKFVKLDGPAKKRISKLIQDQKRPRHHARGRKMRRGHATRCPKAAKICCDGSTPTFDRDIDTPQCQDGSKAKCSQNQCKIASLV